MSRPACATACMGGEAVVPSLFSGGEDTGPALIPMMSLPGRCDIDWEPMFHNDRATFPQARAAVACHEDRCRSCCAVSIARSNRGPTRPGAARCASCLGAVFASMPVATAVDSPNGDTVVKPNAWIEGVKTAGQGEVPFVLWIALGIEPVPDGRTPVLVTVQTIGVADFTSHELLLPLVRLPPDPAARLVFDAALLHLLFGHDFTDRDRLGPELGPEDDTTLELWIRQAPKGALGRSTDTCAFPHPVSTLAPREAG